MHVSHHHDMVGTIQRQLLQLVGCSAAYECSMLHMLFCHMNAVLPHEYVAWRLTLRAS